MDSIYLDNNATTPILPGVAEAMWEAEAVGWANPASQHGPGRRARRIVEDCRERIAEILGARTGGMESDRVVFTSGGTEANNVAVFGLGRRSPQSPSGHVLVSAIEHPSVMAAAEHLRQCGADVETLPVDETGVVCVGGEAERVTGSSTGWKPAPRVRLVSVMLGNNETGVLQPVREIAAICRQAGVLCHTDAVQAVGKVRVSFCELGVDALTCTAHKLHGPRGIGALVVRHGVPLAPQLFGGFQQAGLRPGTEPVGLIPGFCRALEIWHAEADERHQRLTAIRDRFEAAICEGYSDAVVIGRDAPRLPHTSNIAFVGLDRQALQMALDLAGVACSTGSACASGSSEPSPVLAAMGCPEGVIRGSLRFSFSGLISPAEADEAVRRILLTCKNLRGR